LAGQPIGRRRSLIKLRAETEWDYSEALWPNRQLGVAISDRRTQILDVAAQLFYEKGYIPTTMQEIADHAGLLKGSIYHHFPSKEEMLFRIIRSVHEGITAHISTISDDSLEPLDRLRTRLRHHTLYNVRNIEWTTVFYNDFRALDPEHREFIVRERDRYDAILINIVIEAQEQGSATREIPAKLAVFGLLGLVNSIHRWYRRSGAYSPAEIADTYSRIAIEGLVVSP
jgi:TetR/AcrR family transcriptional regulator, cholesterol catabolism regulator